MVDISSVLQSGCPYFVRNVHIKGEFRGFCVVRRSYRHWMYCMFYILMDISKEKAFKI